MSHPKLTREAIAAGELETFMEDAERRGLLERMPDEEREASRDATLARFAPGEDVWVFGYGSLIWNPAFHFAEKRIARIHGLHRRFCLETPLGRGSPEQPGRVLGLDRGGSCSGMAFRLDPGEAKHELGILWRREMISNAYSAAIVKARTDDGRLVRAATFVINRQSPRYCGETDLDKVAYSIAHAEGWLGPCSDYLFQTLEGLHGLGLRDSYLEKLAARVRAYQAAAS
ncbi:MAG: gamma-glutamylcyclotransferase [Minwuia sp.]|nr:gamma-glutamylcyclotransferase [Minwuia sp.]